MSTSRREEEVREGSRRERVCVCGEVPERPESQRRCGPSQGETGSVLHGSTSK